MSMLKDLVAKGEVLKLSNGIDITIKPMDLNTEAEVGELIDNKKVQKAMLILVKNAIKDAIPDATDEEVNKLNKEDLQLITEKVLKVNGLSSENSKN